MTTKALSTVEINGKRYDARTGRLLNSLANQKTEKSQTTANSSKVLKPNTTSTLHRMTDIARPTTPKVSRPRRQTDKSHTLMRQAVKRPASRTTIKAKAQPLDQHKTAYPVINKKPRVSLSSESDVARYKRALESKQNSLITKFSKNKTIQQTASFSSSPTVQKKIANLPMKKPPMATSHLKSSKLNTPSSINRTLPSSKNQLSSKAESLIAKSLKDSPAVRENMNKKQLKKIAKPNKLSAKLALYGSGALALIIVSGFFIYQNIPSLAIQYAKTRSGIQASLPSYKPSGFSLSNKIEYNPGLVKLNFASNSDSREFTITQKQSNWDSQSLLTNYVANKSEQHQKYESKGRTIYLYGGNNATWVNGGIWYNISGNSELNPDQLIHIASSL